ncbi:MAG: hypothetical protein M3552_02995 [Planctomycetota bacterium]|nr:hypothetical protein [Planctomycetaceae bacterium]MDQ3329612.1 hypothetical protein [Planctomycetota bacterium]
MIANGTAPPPTPAEPELDAPNWFARRRATKEARAASEAVRAADAARSKESVAAAAGAGAAAGTLGGQAISSLFGPSAVAYTASLALHSLLLFTFSWVIIHLSDVGATVSTEVGIADVEGDELLDTRAFEISSGVEGIEEPVTIVEPVPIETPDIDLNIATAIAPELKGAADGAGEDAKTSPGAGDDAAFELPKGGNAIQQGSFAAWTVPADPRPGQDYVIVVEVTLPDKSDRYQRTDLSGQLIGSDGYKVMIPDGREWNGLGWLRPRRTPLFRREGEKARIVFFVRGAHQALVRDTIQIRSQLLNEQQKLQIVF